MTQKKHKKTIFMGN